jgi:uncharacterized protein
MMIRPLVTPGTEPYWDGVAQGVLMLQHCPDCGCVLHPPEPVCPDCQSDALVWRRASGTGVLFSYTVVHHPTHRSFADRVPYVVALVELDEGVRLVTSIIGAPDAQLRVGMPVEVVFVEEENLMLPYFRPAQDRS